MKTGDLEIGTRDAAQFLGVTKPTVLNWARRGAFELTSAYPLKVKLSELEKFKREKIAEFKGPGGRPSKKK